MVSTLRHSVILVAALSGLGAGHAAPVPSGTAFRASYHGMSHLPAGHRLQVNIAATGTATLLGASRLQSAATGTPNPGGCIPMRGTGHLHVAAGSSVSYRYRITTCFRPLPPGSSAQKGTYTITAGRGAFKGVRGSGIYAEQFRNQSGPPGPVTVTFRGTVSRR